MSESSVAVDMWRLRLGRRSSSGNGSNGDWQLFESRADAEDALFAAAVESEAHRKVWPLDRRRKCFDNTLTTGGTENMCRQSVLAGIPVHVFGEGKWRRLPDHISHLR